MFVNFLKIKSKCDNFYFLSQTMDEVIILEKNKEPGKFGLDADYMLAGKDNLEQDSRAAHRIPGKNTPSAPLDDRKDGDMSLGELAKEELESIIDD